MTYRTILVAVSGGSASAGAVDLACRLATRFKCHLEGFHVQMDPRDLVIAAGDPVAGVVITELMDKIAADAASTAAKVKSSFDAALGRAGIKLDGKPAGGAASAAWREETGYGPVLVARRARFFDLVVLGRSERVAERPHSDAVEQTLLHSGRPVLLAPMKPPAAIGETVALGWNGSPEAVRAMRGALPFLTAAKSVLVITVGKPDPAGAQVVEHLGWHGVKAKHQNVLPVEGVGPGEQLLSAARDGDADLLVMGGYGHMPWREFFFGGATRQIVGVSLLPILLSH
jgi:nucleotide-binding universal stress UspA family protein